MVQMGLMSEHPESADSDNVEALCLAARERARGGPMSPEEVLRYLALLSDSRGVGVADSDDPPSYDWTGGAPRAGGSSMYVSDEAARTLRKCGGAALVAELDARLRHAGVPSELERVAVLAVDLLRSRSPFVLHLLSNSSPDMRALGLRAVAPLRWRTYENFDLPAPLLVDEHLDVSRQANALIHDTGTWLKPLPGDTLDVGLVEKALQRLQAAPPDGHVSRLESLTYLAILTGAWEALAEALAPLPEQMLQSIVNLPAITRENLTHLLAARPTLRDGLRAAAYARFKAAPPGKRYHELGLVCCFISDPQALELGLEELRLRARAGIEMAGFVRHDARLMRRLLDVALNCARRDQADAGGIKALFVANPQAFASALMRSPAELETRLEKIQSVLQELPSRTEADGHMALLKEHLERLASQPRPRRQNLEPCSVRLDVDDVRAPAQSLGNQLNVSSIASHHRVQALPRTDHDCRIRDVARTASSQRQPGLSRGRLRQRLDPTSMQEARERWLRSPTPHLGKDDGGRNGQ
jgi:hypothetical protein